jgi:RNA polymerase sigma factor (sigma-70 family)
MKTYSETQILEGVIKHNSPVLTFIYTTYYPAIESFVIHHSGSVEHAEDVFQEGLLITYRKLKYENLYLRCKFSTYLYSVCKKIWIQERKKKFIQQEKLKEAPLTVEDSGAAENTIDHQILKELIQKHLSSMSPDCQKILKLTLNDCTVEEIRKELNYKSLHHTIDRKYRCKKGLIKKIVSDPLFKRLRDEIR